jgi:hypothetical protein
MVFQWYVVYQGIPMVYQTKKMEYHWYGTSLVVAPINSCHNRALMFLSSQFIRTYAFTSMVPYGTVLSAFRDLTYRTVRYRTVRFTHVWTAGLYVFPVRLSSFKNINDYITNCTRISISHPICGSFTSWRRPSHLLCNTSARSLLPHQPIIKHFPGLANPYHKS